jgi:hypothetical protein
VLVPKIEKFSTQSEAVESNIVAVDSIDIRGDFYNLDIHYEEKARIKFIKYLEKIVRRSFEYKTYIGFLKNELNLTKCTFLPGVDINEIKAVGLEFHHYPYTLFDITSIVLDEHMLVRGEKHINPFKIAEEIMQLHYQNYIGLVPLTQTIHELVHSGKVFVNLDYVFGNYNKFINLYSGAMSDNYKQMMANLEQLSEQERNGESVNGDILDRNMMTVDVKDIEKTKIIEIEEELLA